jgi:hypothetical protein
MCVFIFYEYFFYCVDAHETRIQLPKIEKHLRHYILQEREGISFYENFKFWPKCFPKHPNRRIKKKSLFNIEKEEKYRKK